jgi:biopolymer transport protein TolR
MAMSIGSRRGSQVASINMTPMIDVLLVLLIIFMVMQQQLQRGLSVQVPPPQPGSIPQPPGDDALVLEVGPGGVYRLNQQPVAAGTLQRSLAQVFAGRNRRVLFVKADERAAYGEVVAAVEGSRAAGATVVGLVPRAAN